MGRPAGWMKELTGRSAMKSPGKPSHRRDVERWFWREIAKGLSTEDAAVAGGGFPAGGGRGGRGRGGGGGRVRRSRRGRAAASRAAPIGGGQRRGARSRSQLG